MGFGNSGNYNNGGGFGGGNYNNGGNYNGGGYNNGGNYNNGGGGRRSSGGGLVCPHCGSNNCHAQIRDAGEKLVMLDRAKGDRSGIMGLLFSGLHVRSRRYASYATCNSCGYSWQVGRSKRSVTALDYVARVIFFLVAGGLLMFWHGSSPDTLINNILYQVISIVLVADLLTGFITSRILNIFL